MISDSLFQVDMQTLTAKAYSAIVVRGMYSREKFETYWKGVSDSFESARKRGQSDFFDVFNKFSSEEWRYSFEAWLNSREKDAEETKEQPQWLDLFTKYAMKDSGNRVQTLINQIEINMDAPIREYFKEQFGEEAGILLAEIMEGLNEQEQERLGKGPKRKVKKPEMSVEAIKTEEPSLPEAENEDELLASLDFLDADIDEMLSLEELEDELKLDDLNLD